MMKEVASALPSADEIVRALGLTTRSVKEVTNTLPSAEEIIRALGIRTRSSSSEVIPGVALFGAGILVGAGLALLFAPTSGRELREEITEKVGELRERVASTEDNGQRADRE